MASSVDTYIEALSMDMEEFYLLSEAERENVYEAALQNLSEEEIESLRQQLQEKMDYLVEEFAVQAAELEDIIDSDDSTVEQRTRAAVDIGEIEEMQAVADQFSSEFGDAQTDDAAHNVATTGNTTVTAGDDVQSGEEYVVDCTEAATQSATPDWAEDEHSDWLDEDGDGIGETDPDADGDGIADEDFNEDGVISETDMLRDATVETTQVISITVEATDTVRVASYDSSTGMVRFSITKEDGTVYYVTVKCGADAMPDIRFTSAAALHSSDFEDLDPELVNRIYTDVSTEYALGHYLGMDDSSGDTQDYYTIVDMADQEDNTYSPVVTSEDVENEREYVITCSSDATIEDTLNFTFPDDCTLDFSSDGSDGAFVITVTDPSGNVSTVRIYGLACYLEETDSGAYVSYYDVINITGGTIDEDDYEDLKDIFVTVQNVFGATEWETYMMMTSIVSYGGQDVNEYFS